nr:protein HEADING DATE REPRESSOR 1 [Ipomoea trifida]
MGTGPNPKPTISTPKTGRNYPHMLSLIPPVFSRWPEQHEVHFVFSMKESTEKSPNPMETLNGFSHVPSTPVFWKSRKRSVSGKKLDLDSATDEKTPEKQEELSADEKKEEMDVDALSVLSERRKALFEPLEPITNASGKRPSAESLLPPPDFDSSSYPKGWLIGKKRKLVNVDVVESMRRIAVQEMNRKDREIDGLNEQLEADARCLEHLQLQLLDERSKRADVERQNNMLQNQINMLMDMLQENDAVEGEGTEDP